MLQILTTAPHGAALWPHRLIAKLVHCLGQFINRAVVKLLNIRICISNASMEVTSVRSVSEHD